jgi:hypothetical protein
VRIHKSSLIGPGLTNVRYVPMLLKKSAKKCCGIETRNDRILQVDPLNRYCLWQADLESIFLREPAKILFQQHLPVATKFRIAAKRRDGPGAALSGCST